MPRRSEASLSIAAFTPGLKRLDPPVEFTEGSIERSLFVETVRSVAAETRRHAEGRRLDVCGKSCGQLLPEPRLGAQAVGSPAL
jgi:hypothetical protein